MSRPLPLRRQKFLRWFTWRRCLKLSAILLALVVAFYEVERWRGKRALDAQLARYAAEGISLNLHDYLPPRVAPEDNFCATPLLDGIALSSADDTVPGWKEAQAKRERLNFQLRYPYGDEDFMAAKKLVPWGQLLQELAKQKIPNGTPRTRPKGAPAYLPRWNITEGAPATAESVYTALDAEKAVFEELMAAARRPKAVFTPQPCEHWDYWIEREVFYSVASLKSLLQLRIAAAAETGRFEEASNLLRVLWRLREALGAEVEWQVFAFADLRNWSGAAMDVLSSNPPAQVIKSLLEQTLRWDPMHEYRRCMLSWAANSAIVWQTLADDAAWTFRGDLHGAFRAKGFVKVDTTRRMLTVPSGWFLQNGARNLRQILDYSLMPFSRGGFASLPPAEAALQAEMAQSTTLDQLIFPYFGDPLGKFMCRNIQQARLTILALAMELHRSTKGCYPDTLAALVPEFMPAIPGDLDGAPLRAVVAADGQKAVIYSIGWNQQDDWHGSPPQNPGRADEAADWFLQLPIVRSEPAPEVNKPARHRR